MYCTAQRYIQWAVLMQPVGLIGCHNPINYHHSILMALVMTTCKGRVTVWSVTLIFPLDSSRDCKQTDSRQMDYYLLALLQVYT